MRQIEPAATRFSINAGRPRNTEAGLTVHDLPAPRTMPGVERCLLRSRPCVAAVRLTAAVLVLAAASLVLVRPAFAQDIWSPTLNVGNVASNIVLGCQNGGASRVLCSDSSVLSDDDFIVNGVTYEVRLFYYSTAGGVQELSLGLNPTPSQNDFAALQIHVGTTAFDFADAAFSSDGAVSWRTTLSWSVGDAISVRIALPPPAAPTNLTAEVKAPTRISLDWDVPGGSLGLTGWYIERSDDGNEPWTSVVNVINPVRDYWHVTFQSHFNDNTITPGTTRHYRVRSFNDSGESVNSNVVSGTTPTLVPQDAGPLLYGRTESRLDSFRDQKVFTADLGAGAEYLFAVVGVAEYHRVEVTAPDGTKIEDFVVDVISDNYLRPLITAQETGEHKIAISKAGVPPDKLWAAPSSERDRPKVGGMRIIFLPETEDEPWNMPVTVGTPQPAVLGTYGDTDQFTVDVQPGKRYVVRVLGRETGDGTASTPWMQFAYSPLFGRYHSHNMARPWVNGYTKRVDVPVTSTSSAVDYEFQAFVIDLRAHPPDSGVQTWRFRVATTARPGDARRYRVGSYTAEVEEIVGGRRALSGRFVSPPPRHDGKKRVNVQVAFSEALDETPENVGEHGVEVEGGQVTSVRPVSGQVPGGRSAEEVVWDFEIQPRSGDDVTMRMEAWRPCDEPGAICTADGRSLARGISTTIEGPGPVPFTAAFEGLERTHDGEGRTFTFRVVFSKDTQTPRSTSFTVDEGEVTGVGRVDGHLDEWEVTINPTSDEAVTITLPGDRACGTSGAVCTYRDNSPLTNSPSATVDGPTDDALTAAFEGLPATHDGDSTFSFRLAFSAVISVSYTTVRDASFQVTAGEVTAARRVDSRSDLWQITIDPASDEAVTIRLPETTDCDASGAICTSDGRPLSHALSATVAGPAGEPERNTPATGTPTIGGTPQVGEELTASTSGISDANGLDNASFGYQWIRAGADIGGATGSTYTPVAADEGKELKVRVSFTDDAGYDESLTSAATDAVAARREPLTASFEGMPAEHAGKGSFNFRVAFSDGISVSYTTVRDASFRVTGGDVTRARRVDKRRDLWKITIEPDSHEAVSVRLPETTDCDASGAICTGDGRPLSHSLSATVAGPVGIAVADARVEEGDGVALAFAVTLSRAASGTVTVDYATADGSAHAGDDYTAASGTLTFAAGERSQKIRVGVLDDAHDEGEETLTLTLSNASSGRLTDGEATGTIENHDPMPRALLARFGRAAAVHVVEHVEERLAAPREPGFRGRFAGRELRRGMERDVALNFLQQLSGGAGAGPMGAGPMGAGGGRLSGAPAAGTAALGMPGRAGGGGRLAAGGGGPMGGAMPMGGAPGAMGMSAGPMGGRSHPDGGFNGGGLLQMGLGGGDVLTGSDFALGRETRHGGILSFWSRGAQSHFSGREGALSLGGNVRTTMFGADYAKGPLVTGLSLSRSRGLGEYTGIAGGQVASSVTGLYPWLGYKATERVTVWGVAGYGAGGMMLTPQGGPALESALSMAMAAAGTRGELVAGGASGFGLAFKADALWVGTSIDGVDGPAGRLKATAAAVTRFRTGLEGSRAYTFGGRLSLKPSVEVGLRHDGGDAETGAGMDVGGGLVVSDASTGLAVDVRVRTLLVHQDQDFSERGVSLSVSYNPTPSTPLGFVARVAPSWGRAGDQRGAGAVGPRDDGGDGARRARAGQPPRWRGGLRAAGRAALRGDAAGRLQGRPRPL